MNWHYDELENIDSWDIKTEINQLEKEGFSYFSCPRDKYSTAVSFYDRFRTYCPDLLDSIWDSAENLKAEFGNRKVLLKAKTIRFYALNRFLEDKAFVREYRLKERQEEEREVARMIFNAEPIPGKYIGREIDLEGLSIMAI